MPSPVLGSGQVSVTLVPNFGQMNQKIAANAKSAAAVYQKSMSGFNPGGVLRDMSRFEQSLGRISSKANEFNKSLDASTARIIAFGATMKIMNTVTAAFGNLFVQARQVEKQMAVLNTVYETSQARLTAIKNELFTIAKSTGSTFDQVTESAVEFARQGFSVAETLKRTKDSIVLMKLSGLDASKSVTAITAALNTFNGLADDSSKFINKLAAVDQAYAVSSRDLAEAISRVGSTAQDAGVSFEQLLGLVTAAQAKTARGGAVIGNAMKSIFTRVNRGDTIDELKALGVAIDESQNGIQKLQALSDAIKNVADPSTASKIKELAGGVYQVNIVAAALQDLSSTNSIAQKAASTALGAQDEAYRKAAILVDTLDAKIQNLATTWNQLSASIGESILTPAFKDLFEIIQSVLNKFNEFGASNPVLTQIAKTITAGILKPLSFIVSLGIAKLFYEFLGFAGKAAIEVLKIGTESKRIAESQALIVRHLATDKNLRETILSTSTSTVAKEKAMVDYMKQEIAYLERINSLSKGMASTLAGAGIYPSEKGGFAQASKSKVLMGKVRRSIGFKADGYLPAIQKEQRAINRGVGGARGAKPVVVKNFRMAGQAPQDVVANSKEYIVKNYAGGADAIFNPEMVRSMGLPKGAKRLAEGYLPNYASGFSYSKNKQYKRLSVADSPESFLDYKMRDGKISVDYLKSARKGDAYSLFQRLGQVSKRTQKPIYSSILTSQGLSQDVLNDTSLRNSDLLLKLYPQLRYRESGNMSSKFNLTLGSKMTENIDLNQAKAIVDSLPRDKFVSLTKRKKVFASDVNTRAFSSGYIPNYAGGTRGIPKAHKELLDDLARIEAYEFTKGAELKAKRGEPIPKLDSYHMSPDWTAGNYYYGDEKIKKQVESISKRTLSKYAYKDKVRFNIMEQIKHNTESFKASHPNYFNALINQAKSNPRPGTPNQAGGYIPNFAKGKRGKKTDPFQMELDFDTNGRRFLINRSKLGGKKNSSKKIENILKQLKIAGQKRYEEERFKALVDKKLQKNKRKSSIKAKGIARVESALPLFMSPQLEPRISSIGAQADKEARKRIAIKEQILAGEVERQKRLSNRTINDPLLTPVSERLASAKSIAQAQGKTVKEYAFKPSKSFNKSAAIRAQAILEAENEKMKPSNTSGKSRSSKKYYNNPALTSPIIPPAPKRGKLQMPPMSGPPKDVSYLGKKTPEQILMEQKSQEKNAAIKQAKAEKMARRMGVLQMGAIFGAPVAAEFINSGNKNNNVGVSALSGTLSGLGYGAMFGVPGMLAGAAIGSITGTVGGMKKKRFGEKFSGSIGATKDDYMFKKIGEQREALEANIGPLNKIQEAFQDITDEQVDSAKAFTLSTLKLNNMEKQMISGAKTSTEFAAALNKVGENISSSAASLDNYEKFLEAVKSVTAEGDTDKLAQVIGSFGGELVSGAIAKVSPKESSEILSGGLTEESIRKLLIKSGTNYNLAYSQAGALNLQDPQSKASIAEDLTKRLSGDIKNKTIEAILEKAVGGFDEAAEKQRVASYNFLASSEAMKATSSVLRGRNEADSARLLSKSIFGEVLSTSPMRGERQAFETDIRRTEIENELKTEERGILQETLSVLSDLEKQKNSKNTEDLIKRALGGRIDEFVNTTSAELTKGFPLEARSEFDKADVTKRALGQLQQRIDLAIKAGDDPMKALQNALGPNFYTPEVEKIISQNDPTKQKPITDAISKFVESAQKGSFNEDTQKSLAEVIDALQKDTSISAAGQSEAIQKLVELNASLVEFKNKPFIETIKELGRVYNEGLRNLGVARDVPKLSATFNSGFGASRGFGVGINKGDLGRSKSVDQAIAAIRNDPNLPDEVKRGQIDAILGKTKERRGGSAARFDRMAVNERRLKQTMPIVYSGEEMKRQQQIVDNVAQRRYKSTGNIEDAFGPLVKRAARLEQDNKRVAKDPRSINLDTIKRFDSQINQSEAGKALTDTIRSKQRQIFENLISSGVISGNVKDNPLAQPQAKISDVAGYLGRISQTIRPGQGGEAQYEELLNQMNELFSLLKDVEKTQTSKEAMEPAINAREEELTNILPENIKQEFSKVQDWTGSDVGQVNKRFNEEIQKKSMESYLSKDPAKKRVLDNEIVNLQKSLSLFNTGMQTVVGLRGGKTEGIPDVAKVVTVDFQQKISADGKIEVSITDANEAAKQVLAGAMAKLEGAITENTRLSQEKVKEIEAEIARLRAIVETLKPAVRDPVVEESNKRSSSRSLNPLTPNP